MSQAQADLIARATDPNAELTTLHTLAQNYPGLRPYIAENPRTYPALLDWLGTLGDPAVDAALARRAAGASQVSGGDATATQMLPPGAALAASQGAAASGASTPSAVPGAGATQPTVSMPAQDQQGTTQAYQPYATYQAAQTPRQYQPGVASPYAVGAAGTGAASTGAAGAPSWAQRPNQAEQSVFGVGQADDEPARRGHGVWLWLLGAVALVLVVALAVWYFLGDRDDAPSGSAESVPTRTAEPEQSEAPATPSTESPSPSPSATPSPTASALPYPAPDGAITLSSFTSPSGNISCSVAEDTVTCTIAQHDFVDATCGADNSLPFTVVQETQGTASGGCDVPGVGGAGATLNYGSAAQNGQMACTSSEAGIECWSQVTGEGFSLNRSGAYSTNR